MQVSRIADLLHSGFDQILVSGSEVAWHTTQSRPADCPGHALVNLGCRCTHAYAIVVDIQHMDTVNVADPSLPQYRTC